METLFENQYFENNGRLNPQMSMYELYLKGFAKVKAFEGKPEFDALLVELINLISYIDSKTVRAECEAELKKYTKSIGCDIDVHVDPLEDDEEIE